MNEQASMWLESISTPEHTLSSHLFVNQQKCFFWQISLELRNKLKWIKYGIVYCKCLLDFEILMKRNCCRCRLIQIQISAIFTHIERIVYTNFVCYISISRLVLFSIGIWSNTNGTHAITSVFSLEMLIPIMQIY